MSTYRLRQISTFSSALSLLLLNLVKLRIRVRPPNHSEWRNGFGRSGADW